MIQNDKQFIAAVQELENKYGSVINPKADKDPLLRECQTYTSSFPKPYGTNSQFIYTATFKNGKVIKAKTAANIVKKIKDSGYSISLSGLMERIKKENTYFNFGKVTRKLNK